MNAKHSFRTYSVMTNPSLNTGYVAMKVEMRNEPKLCPTWMILSGVWKIADCFVKLGKLPLRAIVAICLRISSSRCACTTVYALGWSD